MLSVPPGTRRCRVDAPGTSLALLDAAPAPGAPRRGTALLVPGYTGSKEDFLPLLEPLRAAGHRVLAYDQRGQYESLGPDDPAGYAMPLLAGDLLAVVDRLVPDGPVHAVGHSFGGLVARAAAIERPAALRSVTLLGSGPAAIDGGRADVLRGARPVFVARGHAGAWELTLAAAAAAGAPAPTPDVAAFLHRRFFASAAAGLLAMGDHLLAEPDRVEELRATGLPVLVVHGAADDAWSPAVQARMAERLGARHEVIDGAAHSPNVEAPERTAAALLAFWAAVEAAEAVETQC
ncbi:MAG: alpha/beta fold hydrolase [Frankiaceae bacterium]